jgi:pimeloyl-ACP methyl ester carboxylesterase
MEVEPLQQHAPAPSTIADPPNQTLESRRRPASPARPADARPKKRSPNYIHTQAASPAVISSLIDQLSAISAPAHDHFENLLVGYSNGLSAASVTSVNTCSRGNSSAGQDGSSVNHSAYNHSIREQDDLFPTDDACEPPVIRTSKPPSGYSAVTAPKKKDKSHSLSSYIGRNSCSSASLHSTHSTRSVVSIGNISIEAGGPKPRSRGSERSSVESKRSTKGHRGLMYMGSRERLRLKETERKRHTTYAAEDALAPHDSPRKIAAPSFSYEDTIKEEPTSREEDKPFPIESSRFAQRFPDRSSSPRLRINLVDGPNGESPSEQGLIPERGSSLRHTGSPTRKNRKNRASDTTRRDVHKTEPVVEETANMDPEAVTKDKMLQELEQEENEVARRIRVLKEQKLQRDRIAGERTADGDAGASPSSISRVSAVSSPEPSPTSTVSSESERRAQDPAKAHRVLGITHESATTELPAEAERPVQRGNTHESEPRPTSAMPQVHARRHSRHRSLTLNDGDDMTPLPINYTLALQTLEEASPPTPTTAEMPRARSPPPPSVSVASSRETRSSVASPQRSSSLAVGGRSAIGRKASSLMAVPQKHQHTSSITDGMLNVKPPSVRSASADFDAARHHSMIMPLPDSHSLQLQRRRTSTKKRWSHPDLPAKAEKEHNDKVERQQAAVLGAGAVQRPARPVIEERPASQDSIDIEVDTYLNSPRLSQRIRHPQTGRVISFSDVGDPNGFAVFVCVGMGLTRYVMAFYDQLAATLKLRLITPDRPGIGGSQVDPHGTPLSWPGKEEHLSSEGIFITNMLTDDVLVICQALKITKFSMLAHSAGAVYALATSLRMPQHIRGRVHLLAPWIPPSQMAPIGISQDSPPTQQLPRSQRFLRALPPSFLKVANSTFLSATSASLQRTGPKNPPKTKRKSSFPQIVPVEASHPSIQDQHRKSMMLMDQVLPNASSLSLAAKHPSDPNHNQASQRLKDELSLAERDRQRAFDERLTFAIWDRATAHANPATDLIVCLETRQTIGFRYEDINRPVVIHHGSKDSRVPVANVRWLGKLMRKCEVRILEGEQHGLMASAQVMGNVLTEMASEWEDWSNVVQGKGDGRSLSRKRTAERLRSTMSSSTLASRDTLAPRDDVRR